MNNEVAKRVGSAVFWGIMKAIVYYIFVVVAMVMTVGFAIAMICLWAMGLFFCLVVDIMIFPFRLRRTLLSVRYGGTFGAMSRMVTRCFKTLCH